MSTPQLVTQIAVSLLFGFQVLTPASGIAQQQLMTGVKHRPWGPVYSRQYSRAALPTDTSPMRRLQPAGVNLNAALGPANAGFLAARQIAVAGGALGLVAGKFNADAYQDIAAISYDSTRGTYSLNVLLGIGDGTFQLSTSMSVSFGSSHRIYSVDLNGDGLDDVLIIHGSYIDVLLASNDGSFSAPVSYASAYIVPPFEVASSSFHPYAGSGSLNVSAAGIADVNGDGHLDILVANGATATYLTYLGNGNGTFQTSASSGSLPGSFSDAIFADVNGDGKLDLVTNSWVFLANPAGGFDPPVSLTGAPASTCNWLPGTIAVGDLNGDGWPDVVTADCTDNSVTIYINDGTGGFGPGRSIFAGIDPQSVAVVDADGDAVPDIITADIVSGDINVLLGRKVSGKGDGTFETLKTGYAFGGSLSSAPVIADFNGDGKLDIIVPEFQSDYEFGLAYLQGFGDGTFLAANTYYSPWTSGHQPWYGVGIASADFNGDGIPDFVLGNAGDNAVGVTVFLANSDGTLRPGVNFGNGGYSEFVATGDFDGDGKQDIVASDISSGSIYVFYGSGNGTFQEPQTIATGLGLAAGIVVADFNGDSKPDIAVATSPCDVYVILNTGAKTLAAPVPYTLSSYGYEITAADINGDGRLDLLVGQGGSNFVSILMGNGDGTFATATDFDLGKSYPTGLAIGDLNGDGQPDLAVAVADYNLGMGIVVALGNGDGTFQTPQDYTCSTRSLSSACYPGEVRISDVNHDGFLDLVYTNSQFATVAVMYGNGDGTFQSPQEFSVGGYPYSIAMADLNGDGTLDAVIGNDGFSGVTTLLNFGGAKITVRSSLNPSVTGQNITFTVTAASVIRSVTATSTGSITLKDGSAVLGSARLANGTASFSASTSLSAGNHVITAVYSGDSTFMPGSGSVLQVVNAVSPTYRLSANPSSAVIRSGQSAALTVTATSVGNFNGTINFNCGSLPAGLSCQFAPSSLTLSNGQAATTLMITASRTFMSYAAPTEHIPGREFPLWATFASGLFGLVTLEGASQRKRRQTTIASAIMLVLMMVALTGCGVGQTTTTSHTIQVIATGTAGNGSAIQQQVSITVTLQQ